MIKLLVVFFFSQTLWMTTAFAQNLPQNLEQSSDKIPLTVESTRLTQESIKPGDRVLAVVELSLHPQFSAYEDKLKLFPLAPDGVQVGGLQIKPIIQFTDFAGKIHTGFRGKTTLEFFLEVPSKLDKPIEEFIVDVEYIACTEKYCLPKNQLEIKIPIHPTANVGKSSFIEEKISSNLFLAYCFIFIFGFLTSLTPCVYPLIPITLAVIGAKTANASKAQAFSLSLVYVLGISATYSVLGVIAAKTGALFGQALSYPPVVLAFAAIFMLMALSIYGYFEIQIPHFITRRLTSNQNSKGYAGAFSAGLIAGVVASPCVGPVLVGVLAYIAKSQNVFLGFTLLFTFAMGMGLLFLIIGTFSSLFKKLPRSGGWMDGVKFILGSALLIVALYYLKPILPGAWFTICYVLLIMVALVSFFTKIYRKSAHFIFHIMPFVFCGVAILSPLVYQMQPKVSEPMEEKAAYQNGWMHYSEERVHEAKKQGKPVIIDFYADWCAACMELDEKTFSQTEFIEATKEFVLLKVDATETFPELADLQKKYDVYGLPTIVFINKDGQLLKDLSLTGFEEISPFMQRLSNLQKK